MAEIPQDKRYFRIGEASRIVGVEPYVLRYWESEFPQIRPKRADSNQRTYQREDLELLLEIKRLLYEERMTIEGAKKRFGQHQEKMPDSHESLLETIKAELIGVLKILEE
jgi:DNA-binding transcriptional MerR regulator